MTIYLLLVTLVSHDGIVSRTTTVDIEAFAFRSAEECLRAEERIKPDLIRKYDQVNTKCREVNLR